MIANISIKSYPKEAEMLVVIWNTYVKHSIEGLDFITFKNKRPKNPKTNNRRIAGLKAECISYLKNDEELVKMSVENFIYLMAKSGTDIEIEEEVVSSSPVKKRFTTYEKVEKGE